MYDVSGAGDTVVAVVAAALASGVPIEDGARLANVAAGIVIGKVGTVPIQRGELLGALSEELQPGSEEKVVPLELLLARVAGWRARGLQVVFTNGCFDLLHIGHIALLEQARRMGDRLIVAVNSDGSVRRLKGSERPLVQEQDRARILAALAVVDAVVVFDESTPLQLIEMIRPDVLVKGGDYTEDEVVGATEVRGWGGRVELVPLVAGSQHHQPDRAVVLSHGSGRLSAVPLLLSVRIPTLLAIFWRKRLAPKVWTRRVPHESKEHHRLPAGPTGRPGAHHSAFSRAEAYVSQLAMHRRRATGLPGNSHDQPQRR